MSYMDEYRTLRDEMLYYMKSRDQITMFFLTSALAVIGYNIWAEPTSLLILYVPVFISLFAYTFYTLRTLYILKIDSYIRVFLEKNIGELNWHNQKYNYSLGIIYRLGKLLNILLFVIPIYWSFFKILLIDNKTHHWVAFASVSILIFLIEVSKSKSVKTLF